MSATTLSRPAPAVPPSRPRRYRRIPVSIAIAVVMVLVAELAVRALSRHLTPNLVWAAAEDQMKVDQMKSLAHHGVRGGVVFAGTSLADVGIDPVQFTKEAGLREPAYNAALGGSDLAVDVWWITHVVVPTLHPRVLVFGLTSRELNPNDVQAKQLRQLFFSAPAVHHIARTESVFEFLERKADDWSYLFRYRKFSRIPKNLVQGPPKLSNRENLGMSLRFAQVPYFQGPALDQFFRQTVLHQYAIGSEQLGILRSLLADLHRSGITPILVDMPVTAHYLQLHPQGPGEYAAYEAALAVVGNDSGAFITPQQVWATTLFADPIHLNGSGAAEFTAWLSGQLRPHLPAGV